MKKYFRVNKYYLIKINYFGQLKWINEKVLWRENNLILEKISMQIGLIGDIGPAATDFYYRNLIEKFASEKKIGYDNCTFTCTNAN